MRIIISTIALLICLPAMGQQPQWASLIDTVEAALDEDNPEVSKQIYLYQRCAANRLAVGAVLQEADASLAETYDQSSTVLAQAAAITRMMLAVERTGQQPDAAQIGESTKEVVISLFEQYQSWLNNNYLLNGSYFENDLDFQLEMEICSLATQLASSLLEGL